MDRQKPRLCIVIPCYNEEKVLPLTAPKFLSKLKGLTAQGKIAENSRVLFVNDGSRDSTWTIIEQLTKADEHCCGIAQSRNRGHQNAVLAGLMECLDHFDAVISIDCDGQDDIDAMDAMVDAYREGCEVVYGVRSSRATDSFFKRFTAESFYRLMQSMGVDLVFNHADYRLIGSEALRALSGFEETNLFLRGMLPLVGFKSSTVSYERHEREAGQSHYPLKKMLALAVDGITSFSIKPIRLILLPGLVLLLGGILWLILSAIIAKALSLGALICAVGGLQLIAVAVVGEYVGKAYMEAKRRPRYIIAQRSGKLDE